MPLEIRKDTASCRPYAGRMATRRVRPPTLSNLARNLTTLMRITGWNQSEVSRRSGGAVSQRHISDILKGTADCTTEMANDIAKVFGLQGWHLIMPNLPEDLVNSPSIQKIVEAYIKADESGREFLDAAAQRELKRDGTGK
jgi:hypothetical protein